MLSRPKAVWVLLFVALLVEVVIGEERVAHLNTERRPASVYPTNTSVVTFSNSQAISRKPTQADLDGATFVVYTKDEIEARLAPLQNEVDQLKRNVQALSDANDALTK